MPLRGDDRGIDAAAAFGVGTEGRFLLDGGRRSDPGARGVRKTGSRTRSRSVAIGAPGRGRNGFVPRPRRDNRPSLLGGTVSIEPERSSIVAAARLVLSINGASRSVPRSPDRSLLDLLRFDLGLTGTKYGCGEGECGACTVLVDGAPVPSCQVRAIEADGARVVTIEGLAPGGELNEVQRSFLEHSAFQCGYCTPGMIVRATALLDESPDPSDEEIVEAMEGNLCRCGGYTRILRAVRRAAELRRNAGGAPR